MQIEKVLNDNLVMDNKDFIKSSSGNMSERGLPMYNFQKDVIEDLKVRSLIVMQREQRDAYMQTKEDIEKMKSKRFNLNKQYKDYNNLMLSFYTRYTTME